MYWKRRKKTDGGHASKPRKQHGNHAVFCWLSSTTTRHHGKSFVDANWTWFPKVWYNKKVGWTVHSTQTVLPPPLPIQFHHCPCFPLQTFDRRINKHTCILLVLSNCDFVNGYVNSLIRSVKAMMETPHAFSFRPAADNPECKTSRIAIVGPVRNPNGPAFDAAVSTTSPAADPATASTASAIDSDDDADDANTSWSVWSCCGKSWRWDGSMGANARAVVDFPPTNLLLVAPKPTVDVDDDGVKASTTTTTAPEVAVAAIATRADAVTFILSCLCLLLFFPTAPAVVSGTKISKDCSWWMLSRTNE